MRKIFGILIIIIALGLVGAYMFKQKPLTTTPFSYCSPHALEANLVLDHGAGNVYGTFTIKNVSQQPCKIDGNMLISTTYNADTAKNIAIDYVGKSQTKIFSLYPNQTIYSQVHYPNGPQCQSSIQITKVAFNYPISPKSMVTFATADGNIEQDVVTCTSATEITTIQLWNFASKPLH